MLLLDSLAMLGSVSSAPSLAFMCISAVVL